MAAEGVTMLNEYGKKEEEAKKKKSKKSKRKVSSKAGRDLLKILGTGSASKAGNAILDRHEKLSKI